MAKEAKFAYDNTDDCLFVGLRQKGEEDNASFRCIRKYDEDLLKATDGKYCNLCDLEAFRRIRLKDDTVEGYGECIVNIQRLYPLWT